MNYASIIVDDPYIASLQWLLVCVAIVGIGIPISIGIGYLISRYLERKRKND